MTSSPLEGFVIVRLRRFCIATASALVTVGVVACFSTSGLSGDSGTGDAAADHPPAPADAADTDDTTPLTDGGTVDDVQDAAKTQLRVFVTSKTYVANQIDLASADMFCQTLATDAGLGGPYVAWLSTGAASAKTRVQGTGPWVGVDGTSIATTRAVLLSGALENALELDEKSTKVVGSNAWTGTARDGTATGVDCNAWSTPNGSGTAGAIGATDPSGHWTNGNNVPCQGALRLYCFEQP